jgi:tetratricopeptide (TPR) repeat protein
VGRPLGRHATSCLENDHEPVRTAETAPAADPTSAIEQDPQDAMAHHNRGLARSELGDYQQAIENFTRTIAIEPQNAQAFYNRGAA